MARDNYRFACRADVSKQELKEVLRLEKCCEMACVRYQLDLFDRRDDIIKVFPRHFGRRQHILLTMKDEETSEGRGISGRRKSRAGRKGTG